MSDLLNRLDAAIDGLCPCGAEPRPGSAYCGDDCTPTHIIATELDDHGNVIVDGTDTRELGQFATPMRWRPDLVTEVDDTDLTMVRAFRRGPYRAQVFQRDDSSRLHLRLDDDHRFVGCDTNGFQVASDEGLNPIWERLERELGNSRHIESGTRDPWADVFGAVLARAARRQREAQTVVAGLTDYAETAARQGEPVTFQYGTTPQVQSPISPMRFDPGAISAAVTAIQQAAGNFVRAMRPAFEAFDQAVLAAAPELELTSQHPMLAAIEARRNRNTGPDQRHRAPRQIKPRRGR